MSKSHEEALAHLSYAISQGDGFVEITGEVGTGKTTLCRVFLENLDKSINAAYIFNPKLDALQLLKAINDELGIDSSPDNTKDLIDRLNAFLIAKKAAGQKVLVLIDEAQNLSLEVLEQLRLLSNLETTQEKLLQIILVGQPELGDLLSSHQLRQLGQRITINCQISPLTSRETRDYIRHRIALASHRAGPPFDKASYRAIYEYSRGIPRLINIACDRILLNAFGRNSFKITGAIAKEAIRELNHKKRKQPSGLQIPSFVALAAIMASLAAAFLYINYGDNSNTSVISKTYSLPEASEIKEATPPGAAELPPDIDAHAPPEFQKSEGVISDAGQQIESQNLDQASTVATKILGAENLQEPLFVKPEADTAADSFLNFLKRLNSRGSRNSAMQLILELWNPAASISQQTMMIDTDPAFYREAAAENELLVQPLATEADINLIHILDLPAILTFYLPNHAWPKYLAIAGIDSEKAYLDAGDQGGIIAVDKKVLLQFWSGEAYIVWKDFIGIDGIITEQSGPKAVKALKMLLHDLAYMDDISTDQYDAETKKIIQYIQTQNGLNADGKVGPLTKIALYNERSEFIKPSLVKFEAARTENGS